jgi:hypothetical protein
MKALPLTRIAMPFDGSPGDREVRFNTAARFDELRDRDASAPARGR